MNLDNPATESSAPLDTNQAATLFATMLDPEPAKQEPKAEPETATPEPEAAETEAPAEVEAQAEEDDPTVTVKIDGKEVEVRLSELKNGYQRQADYTRKTMETAETRKAAEAEKSKAYQERQAYAADLQRMQVQLEGALQEQQKVDWQALINSDPVEYLRQQHLAQTRQAQLQQVAARQEQLARAVQAEQQEALSRHLQDQQAELLAKVPDWRDATKAKAERVALREYLTSQGYDEAAVNSIADAKAVVLARKAMLYDQMMSKAKAEAKRVSTLPTKVERPSVGENPGLDRRNSAYQKLSKSGRVEDAASVFASLL